MVERAAATKNLSDRKNRFLLIVDSDLVHLKYAATLLRRFGYNTYTASRAVDALDIVSVKVPSLIITALGLKDRDGLELIKQVRQEPRMAQVRFIALTRQGDMIQEALCFEAGVSECISLPVSVEHLFRAVQAAMETMPRMNMRVRTMQPVKVADARTVESGGVYTLDLSERGMFVRITEPAPLNAHLALRLELSGRTIPIEAAVLYRCEGSQGQYQEPGMGLGFVRIAPQDRACIRDFIRSEMTRGVSPGLV